MKQKGIEWKPMETQELTVHLESKSGNQQDARGRETVGIGSQAWPALGYLTRTPGRTTALASFSLWPSAGRLGSRTRAPDGPSFAGYKLLENITSLATNNHLYSLPRPC